MKKTCKNCRHYIVHEGEHWNTNYGRCCSDKIIYGDSSDSVAEGNDKLFFMDNEWYSADVEVGENFGCVHWEREGEEE